MDIHHALAHACMVMHVQEMLLCEFEIYSSAGPILGSALGGHYPQVSKKHLPQLSVNLSQPTSFSVNGY